MQPGCSFTAFSTASETETPFFDLHVFISKSFVSILPMTLVVIKINFALWMMTFTVVFLFYEVEGLCYL